MTAEQLALIADVVRRTPEWVRHDLLSKDIAGRQRAEEALAAMIAAALHDDAEVSRKAG
jgi:hypothetical protein